MALKPIYLYRFENGEQTFLYTNVGLVQPFEDEDYLLENISHSKPKIDDDLSRADVKINVPFDNAVAVLHSLNPLPNKTTVLIYKFYKGLTDPEVYWRGEVVRPVINDSHATLECDTTLSSLNHEGLPENHQPLCNKRLGDGRCPVNLENFKVPVVVTNVGLSDSGVATVTVTGIAQPDDWFERGTIRAPNGDWRFIVAHVGDVLTLDHAFPADTLAEDDTPDIFPGCDRAYTTCQGKFGSETGEGDAFGGDPIVPNVNPHEYGRML